MPSGQTGTLLNRLPAYTGDDVVFGKVYATGGIDGSGAGVSGGTPQVVTGFKRRIYNAARTLTTADSGALCQFSTAAGYTYTLPIITADNVGIWFEFLWTITNTSVATKIITGQATDLMIGGVVTYVDATTPAANPGPKGFSFNGSTHIAFTCGGSDTTAGGLAGTRVIMQASELLKWTVFGQVFAAGTIVTPAATS